MSRPAVVPCVGAVIHDRAGRLLLVRRGRPPAVGSWSLPGGRVEPGEDAAAAVRREVAEETGLAVRVGRRLGRVERPGAAPEVRYAITDYEAEVVGGRLAAGDDAADVRWCTGADLAALPLTPGLLATLAGWGALRVPGQSAGTGRPGCSPPCASP